MASHMSTMESSVIQDLEPLPPVHAYLPDILISRIKI